MNIENFLKDIYFLLLLLESVSIKRFLGKLKNELI
jgi:hypothetical protein